MSSRQPAELVIHIIGQKDSGKRTMRRVIEKLITKFQAFLFRAQLKQVQMKIVRFNVCESLPKPIAAGKDEGVILIFLYNICDEQSLNKLHPEILKFEGNKIINLQRTFLIGNKIDMEYWRTVSLSRLHAYTQQSCFELSLHSGLHLSLFIDSLFPFIFQSVQSSDVQEPPLLTNPAFRSYLCELLDHAVSLLKGDVILPVTSPIGPHEIELPGVLIQLILHDLLISNHNRSL
jgi:hypothetical protein